MRFRPCLAALLWLTVALPGGGGARAQMLPSADPGQQCRRAIAAAEQAARIPAGLMAAIARVESGRERPDGRLDPWPWSINAEGAGQVFDTKPAAIAAVRALQARGVRSVDVGCMQVNLRHHPDAFVSLDQAFDPGANAAFAAHFLSQLYAETGSWLQAAALYHSATPELAAEYRRKVMAAWPVELAKASGEAAATQGTIAVPVWTWRPTDSLAPGGVLAGRVISRIRAGTPRTIPLPPGQIGRSLASYRAMPVPLAAGLAIRLSRRPG
jgi:hypothetical protein